MCMHRRYAKTALVTHLIAIVSVKADAEALRLIKLVVVDLAAGLVENLAQDKI